MTKLRHHNLVQLYGVCSKNVRPIFIITEYMKVSHKITQLRSLRMQYLCFQWRYQMKLQIGNVFVSKIQWNFEKIQC